MAKSYNGTTVEDIAKRARVTTGAVFHHFKTKRDVMVGVFEQVENEFVDAMLAACACLDSPLERFSTGNRTFLEMCTDRSVATIALREAPIALGWEKWKEIDEHFGLDLIKGGLVALVDAGVIGVINVNLIAPIVLTALMEAGAQVAASDDPARTVDEAVRSFERMVLGFKD